VSRDRKRLLVTVVLAIAGSVLAVLLIGQAAHFATLLARLQASEPAWLVVCVAGEVLAYTGYICSYQAMAALDGGPRLSLSTVVRVVGLAFGAFSVATAIGGLSVDFWALREAGEPKQVASARVIALETMRWAVVSLAVCVAAVAVLVGLERGVGWVVPVGWLVVVPLCFAGGIWISAPGRRGRFIANTSTALRTALGIAVRALVYIRVLLRESAGVQVRAIGGGALFWGGEILCAWAALRAFGTSIPPAPLLLGYMTGYISVGLPLPLGGAGSVDAAMTGGFVLAGAPLGTALLAAIVFRLFSFWLPALGALLSVVTIRGLRTRLREVAEARRLTTGGGLSAGMSPAPESASAHHHPI
jgi:uncharacterized membrane protein YbhN (UPF0104 family)